MEWFSLSHRGLVVAAVVGAFACLAAPGASAAPLLWTVNASEGSVSTFEIATDKAVGPAIPTGEDPISIAITPDGKRAYVANFGGDSVTAIETATRRPIATIPLPANAEGIAISPDGRTAYVTVKADEDVFPIDTETNTVETPIPVGSEASAIAFSPDGRQAYVGIAPEAVQAIETTTGRTVGKPIDVGGLPSAIVFTPDGETAYVAAGNELAVIDTASGQLTKSIASLAKVSGIAMDPRGLRLYVGRENESVTVYATSTSEPVGLPIALTGEPAEVAIAPSGKTAYVAVTGAEVVTPLDLSTGTAKAGTPIDMAGSGVGQLVVAPDRSPTAAFVPPSAIAMQPVAFSGAGSTDPDGSIASYSWAFGDGGTATGFSAIHTYAAPGTDGAQLSVIDNEGCGARQVFTGRTAYCGGSPMATVAHPVEVKAPAPASVCRARFGVAGTSHNRRNGTVRLRLRFPTTGSFLLFGKKVHAVTRKVRRPGTTTVTLHARVELNKRLKKTLRASVRYRITFTPSAGCGSKTVHRSVALLRAPRMSHRR